MKRYFLGGACLWAEVPPYCQCLYANMLASTCNSNGAKIFKSHLGGSLGSECLKPAAGEHLSSAEPSRWYPWNRILSPQMKSTRTSTYYGLPCLILDLRLRLFLFGNLARMTTATPSVKASYYIDGGKDQ